MIDWDLDEANEDGTFRASGNVVALLRGHLARGDVDEAVRLYESCASEVAGDIWAEFPSASRPMKEAIARMLHRVGEHARSARAHEILGDLRTAAAAYEAAGDYRAAAKLHREAGDLDEAGRVFERAGDYIGAAMCFVRTDERRAEQLLAHIDRRDPRFVQAVALLSDALIKIDRRALAIRWLGAAIPPGGGPLDPTYGDLARRLSSLLFDAGRADDARRLLARAGGAPSP